VSARIRAGSVLQRFLCYVLVDVSAEKPCSHKYVDDRRCEMAASLTLCEQQCRSHRLTYLILFSVNRQRIFPADILNFEWKIRGINGGGIKMICNLVLDIVFSLDFWKYLKNCIELTSS
jgi:hypothetical protein